MSNSTGVFSPGRATDVSPLGEGPRGQLPRDDEEDVCYQW